MERLLEKLTEYMDNGARLGILIDPQEQRACVYRPGRTAEVFERPDCLPAEPEMPGLVFDLTKIW